MANRAYSSVRTIKTLRVAIEQNLTLLLLGTESTMTLDTVRDLIFEAEPAELGKYVTTMLTELNSYDIYDTDDTLLEIIQEAWNCFPHRYLNGRCPAELMIESTRQISR